MIKSFVLPYIFKISDFQFNRHKCLFLLFTLFSTLYPLPFTLSFKKIFFCFLLFFTLYPLPFTLSLYALRQESTSYTNINGGVNWGSKYLNSISFESSASIEELAYSSWTSVSYMKRTGHLSRFPLPSPINDLNAVIISTDSIILKWSSPAGDSERNSGKVIGYIVRFSSLSAILSEIDFLNAQEYVQNWTPLEPGTKDSKTLTGFNPAITYYFAIESINEHFLRSEKSNMAYAIALVPLSPLNLNITSSGNNVTLTWLPPAGYKTGIRFNDRFNLIYPYEISGYQIYRATSVISDNWQIVANLSSSTLNYTDTVPTNDEYYYYVKAKNYAGLSEPSGIIGSISKTLQYVALDKMSVLEIPKGLLSSFISTSNDPMDVYTIEFSSHPDEIQGRVIKSIEFAAYKGGITKDSQFKFNGFVFLNLYYQKSGDTIIPSESRPSVRVPDYKRMSIYYYDGSKWIQLYGKVDESKNKIQLQTKYPGKYQIRLVERLGGFSADASGLLNRMITPNEDGKNDIMVFVYDYGESSKVKGKIYDLKGAFISDMKMGPISNSLTWDGKAGGKIVPGGVYIYQIECEGKVYNGTVVVIK